MRIEYDKQSCAGWFQCIQKWDAFEMDVSAGKAELADGNEIQGGVYEREVPSDSEEEALEAVESCPVDAIEAYDDNGNLLQLDGRTE